MKNWERLQRDMTLALLNGDYESVKNEIVGGGSLNAEEALDVYRKSYRARLTESLGETFEAVWWVLGDEDFFSLCKDFINQQPSSFYNLSDYGEGFPDFMENRPGLEELPFLRDLARFEWLFKDVFHSKSPAGVEDFSRVNELSRFIWNPSARLYDSPYSVTEIWKHRADADAKTDTLEWRRPLHLLVYKKDHRVHLLPLQPEAFEIFKYLKRGQNLQQALEKASQSFESLTPELVSETFSILAQTRIIKELQ